MRNVGCTNCGQPIRQAAQMKILAAMGESAVTSCQCGAKVEAVISGGKFVFGSRLECRAFLEIGQEEQSAEQPAETTEGGQL